MKPGFVYIMTNKNHTTLYTGVTSNLSKRIQQHKEAYYEQSFTSRYKLYILAVSYTHLTLPTNREV